MLLSYFGKAFIWHHFLKSTQNKNLVYLQFDFSNWIAEFNLRLFKQCGWREVEEHGIPG